MKTILLSDTQWENRMKTIATKRLHKFRKALTATSMGHYFNDAVLEIREDYSGPSLLINVERYNELRALFMNNSDDELRSRGMLGQATFKQ